MRRFYFLLVASSFFITGCFSSNYTLNDFDSKEEYYNKFNDFAKDNEVDLTLKNGNIVHANEGSKIFDDSITFSTHESIGKKTTLSLTSINEIKYTSLDYKQAEIVLKNGEKLKAKDIEILPHSLMFTAVKNSLMTETIPLKKIREIHVEKPSFGIWSGIGLAFVGLGILVAAKIFPYERHGNDTEETFEGQGMFLGIPAAVIAGGAAGWIIGYDINYHFR